MTLSRTSKSAKKRVAEQKRNKAGKFTSNKRYKDDNDDDFIPELSDSDNFYSENSDSDSDECANQRINCLPEFKLVWTDIAILEQKKKAAYTGNLSATHYRKYGPQGSFTIAAKGTSSLTNFFKPINNSAEDELVIDLTGK